jgi:hypothetical protein
MRNLLLLLAFIALCLCVTGCEGGDSIAWLPL